jgi:hypothetical protein
MGPGPCPGSPGGDDSAENTAIEEICRAATLNGREGQICPWSDPQVQSLPLPERSELLALARGLLDALPHPSRARELALAIVRRLEAGAEEDEKSTADVQGVA